MAYAATDATTTPQLPARSAADRCCVQGIFARTSLHQISPQARPPSCQSMQDPRSPRRTTTPICGSRRSTGSARSAGWTSRTAAHSTSSARRPSPLIGIRWRPSWTGRTTSPLSRGAVPISTTSGKMPRTRAAYGEGRRSTASAPRSLAGRPCSMSMRLRRRKKKTGYGTARPRYRARTTWRSFPCHAGAATRRCCANSTSRPKLLSKTDSICRRPRAAPPGSTATRCCCQRLRARHGDHVGLLQDCPPLAARSARGSGSHPA
jgi:hypothetical protein